MDRKQALDKIAKCMALGKSANEHEAAAAMRQAQKLMTNFGISEKDLDVIGFAAEKVQTAIQAGKKVPVTISGIVALIKHAFGVVPVYGRTLLKKDYNWNITYFGREDRVMLACYAHVVVARAVEQCWQKHMQDFPLVKGVVGGRAGFYAGWLNAVYETLDAFVNTPEDEAGAAALKEQTYAVKLIGEGGKEVTVSSLSKAKHSNTRMLNSTHEAGTRAADGFSLHRPVTANTNRLKIGN